MKKETALPVRSHAKNIVFSAVFAALCCVGTLVIIIPLPYGYFNAGDIFVLLAGWCLGPVYGFAAAAVGSALADVLGGYVLYAPVTFLVKGLDALCAYFVWYSLKKVVFRDRTDLLPRALSAAAGEALMVGGYFVYESFLYGFAGAAASLSGNTLQGAFCLFCSLFLIAGLYRIRYVRRLFPALDRAKEEKR